MIITGNVIAHSNRNMMGPAFGASTDDGACSPPYWRSFTILTSQPMRSEPPTPTRAQDNQFRQTKC